MKESKRNLILQIVFAVGSLAAALTMGILFHRDQQILSKTNISSAEEDLVVLKDSYSFEKVNARCDRPGIKFMQQEGQITFGEATPGEGRTTKCPWGLGDNLTSRKGKLAARYEQIQSIQLPPNAVLCGMQLQAIQPAFTHQNHFLFTMNNRVLVTDAEFLFKYFQEESVQLANDQKISSYIYDWSRILGVRIPQTQSETHREYCIGRDISLANCSFSGSAPFLEVDDKVTRWLGSKAIGPNMRFNLTVTGDGDNEKDCSHSPLSFKVKLKYVIAND